MKFVCDSKYIVLPVNHHAKKKKLQFINNGKLIYDLDIELDFKNPDHDFYLNVERFIGMEIELRYQPEMDIMLRKSDIKHEGEEIYKEKYRPGFHFSTQRGWINDPNGLVCYNDKYLMFYQHNPVGCKWGNMHWGYAVSHDLVHWSERDIALYPDEMGTMFSGSAIIDKKNVTGLKEGDDDVILLYYTAAGNTSELSKDRPFTQCLAYSVDGGITFRKYEKNPIVPEMAAGNRDPKVIYHEETDSYIMALYLTGNKFALLSSKNLLDWTLLQEITLEDDAECPDFYPLAVDGDAGNIKWVFYGASDRYLLGSFDGLEFKPDTKVRRLHYGNSSYASQSWSDIKKEDGRRIRISWNTFEIPSMPFNKCMTFPCEKKLKTFSDGVFLCTYPVREIEKLYAEVFSAQNTSVMSGEKYAKPLDGKYYDIALKVCDVEKGGFNISAFGLDIYCNTAGNELKCLDCTAPLESYDDTVDLRILIDATGTEIFINEGKAFLSVGHIQDYNLDKLEIHAAEKDITIREIKIAEIRNIWVGQEK